MPILPQSEGFAVKIGENAEISFFKTQRHREQRSRETEKQSYLQYRMPILPK